MPTASSRWNSAAAMVPPISPRRCSRHFRAGGADCDRPRASSLRGALATKQSILPRKERVDCFVASAPRNDGRTASHFKQPPIYKHSFAISPRLCARGLPGTSRLLKIRGRRECRALDAPVASCVKKQTHEHSHHGHTGTTRHSPRNGFTAYFALSPVTRLV